VGIVLAATWGIAGRNAWLAGGIGAGRRWAIDRSSPWRWSSPWRCWARGAEVVLFLFGMVAAGDVGATALVIGGAFGVGA
jgi:hypothetical protein